MTPAELKSRQDKEMLALFSLLTEADLHRIAPAWNRLAPPGYRGLLQAQSGSPHVPAAGKFWWDPDVAMFGLGTRGHVPASAIRGAVDAFNKRHAEELAALALATAQGVVRVSQFGHAMELAVKTAQAVNAAAGRGGVEALTRADIELAEDNIEYQLERLGRFTLQIDLGLAEQAAAARAAAYAKSAISTFDDMGRRAAQVAGYTMELNVLGAADHCFWNGPQPQPRADCPTLTKLGWVSLGELPPIGFRLCLWNCRCRIAFRRH